MLHEIYKYWKIYFKIIRSRFIVTRAKGITDINQCSLIFNLVLNCFNCKGTVYKK